MLNNESALLFKIYPPCDIDYFTQNDNKCNRNPIIVSLGQFRSEKNHTAQLKILHSLLKKYKAPIGFKLLIIGSCRGIDDEKRVEELEKMAKNLKVESFVEFVVNKNVDFVRKILSEATIGIHTMIDEHFGISLVEMMVFLHLI